MRWLLVLLALLCCSCSNEMSAMQLYNEASGRFDKHIVLDWAIIGGDDNRSERLLLVEDGHARRNKGGNLYTRTALGLGELVEIAELRERWGRIDIEWQSSPRVKNPSAYRLRFDGHGKPGGEAEVRAFAELMLERVAPAWFADYSPEIVEAVVVERHRTGWAKIEVRRAIHETIAVGTVLEVTLPEAREGAGGVPTVFAIADGNASYMKVRYDDIASRILRADGKVSR